MYYLYIVKLKQSVMNITELVPKLEMEFDMKETLNVLRAVPSIYWSWGVSKIANLMGKGLILKVNGNHHKGYVMITLSYDDTYSVYIVNRLGRILNEYKMIYFDQLTEIIDNRIEKISEYIF